jgi:hypothetical protein
LTTNSSADKGLLFDMVTEMASTRGKTPGNDLCIVSSRSRISINLNS